MSSPEYCTRETSCLYKKKYYGIACLIIMAIHLRQKQRVLNLLKISTERKMSISQESRKYVKNSKKNKNQ